MKPTDLKSVKAARSSGVRIPLPPPYNSYYSNIPSINNFLKKTSPFHIRSNLNKKMYILGISAFYHDSAACLVKDGEIVAAAQEERFTRIKHDHKFPSNSIQYCLKEAGIDGTEIDFVAFYEKPFKFVNIRVKVLHIMSFPLTFVNYLQSQLIKDLPS